MPAVGTAANAAPELAGEWAPAQDSQLWRRVDALIDSSPGLADLRAHGLHLLAASRWRAVGISVPADLVEEEVHNVVRTSAVPSLLAAVRAACDGPVVVMKGPVVASRYPAASRRPLLDLDLLVADAAAAQAALIAAGFLPAGDPEKYLNVKHHLRPLRVPDGPLHVELHRHPKWIEGLEPPPVERLLEEAIPVDLGIQDCLTLAPAHHVLILAAHLWAHDPLTRLSRVLDVAVMEQATDREELEAIARSWGMARVWKTTREVSATLFGGTRKQPLPLRVSGRGLTTAREVTVLELQIGRFLNPFYVYRPVRALRVVMSSFGGLLGRKEGETWRRKLGRTAEQLARPSMRRSEHVRSIFGEKSQPGETKQRGRRSRP